VTDWNSRMKIIRYYLDIERRFDAAVFDYDDDDDDDDDDNNNNNNNRKQKRN
jgi:hypothetical protein